ncbi:MAG: FAD binding domain-containing protein [Benniella sp.]|nr:MAG: FAD binding domain-containing protein [Benniella sp.]
MASAPKIDIPVLICGGGPTGLYAAVLLTKLNIPCRIIERHLETSPLSKALVIHSRTLEIFAMSGVIDKFLDRGQQITSFHAYIGSKQTAVLPALTNKESHFSFGLFLEQHRTSAILTEELEALGQKVDRGWELVDTKVVESSEGDQPQSWVETTIRRAISGSNIRETESKILGVVEVDPEEEGKKYEIQVVRSHYLIATDGGKSLVRHKLNIGFPGRTVDNSMIIYDGHVECDIPFNDVTVIQGVNDHTVGVFPLHDKQVRIIIDNGYKTPEEHAALRSEDLKVEQLEELVRACIAPAKFKSLSCSWLTYYRVNERQAEHFAYKNRIFLAGDAAHVHSPAGGQGMNMGLHDSYNLTWKMALVLHGIAPESLLETYEAERKPVADSTIKMTARFLEAAFTQGFLRRTLRKIAFTIGPYILPYIAPNANPVTMLTVRYHENAINRHSKSQASVDEAFQVGQRARDGNLVVIRKQSNVDVDAPAITEGESVRLHELTVSPGVFHVVVFTSDMLLSTKRPSPGTLIKGVETTNAEGLAKEIQAHLTSWRSKWAYKSMNVFVSSSNEQTPTMSNASLEAVFMVHVLASDLSLPAPCDQQLSSTELGIDVLADNKTGEGKIYLDHQGQVHQKYGVTAKHGPGTIVIVRPDGHIGYRVLGTAKPAWEDVNQYFESILAN